MISGKVVSSNKKLRALCQDEFYILGSLLRDKTLFSTFIFEFAETCSFMGSLSFGAVYRWSSLSLEAQWGEKDDAIRESGHRFREDCTYEQILGKNSGEYRLKP